MVYTGLSIGGFAGVLLSGAFLYWEIGAYAAPQVPKSLFDERKVFIAYVAGLFVGVPLAFLLILLFSSFVGGFLLSVLFEILLLVGATELVQWLLLRSVYFGTGDSGPFYALSLRAGLSAILILAAVTVYLNGPSIEAAGLAFVAAQAVAILSVEVSGGLLSLPAPKVSRRIGGSPLSGGLVGGIGFFLLGLGLALGPWIGIAAAALASAGAALSYRRLRRVTLGTIRPPAPPRAAGEDETSQRTGFGRIER